MAEVDLVEDTFRSLGVLELLAAGLARAVPQPKHGILQAVEALKKKSAATQPFRVDPRCRLHVLVVGGGPIGLRAACEMSLLGHKVAVCMHLCMLIADWTQGCHVALR